MRSVLFIREVEAGSTQGAHTPSLGARIAGSKGKWKSLSFTPWIFPHVPATALDFGINTTLAVVEFANEKALNSWGLAPKERRDPKKHESLAVPRR